MYSETTSTQSIKSPRSTSGQSTPSGDLTIVNPRARRQARLTSNALKRGSVLNETYEIRRVLGRGGMGQVLEARDRLLNRTVAIKVSWAHIGFDPLVQEAQALAALRGRGVPSVYAIGKHDELGYYVMERLYGRTLAAHMLQRFSDGRFTVEEALDILIGISSALIPVHGAGLIHRDLKPSNIMLAPKNRTVLLDFGLFLTEGSVTNDSGICGSPRYIAPEVITANLQRGQAHLIDIYAMGIIAYMLLSGTAPFDDPSVTQLLSKHVQQDAAPLRVIRPDVPARLSRMVDQMLAKQPEERTFSAEAVVAGLRAIRDEMVLAAAEAEAKAQAKAKAEAKARARAKAEAKAKAMTKAETQAVVRVRANRTTSPGMGIATAVPAGPRRRAAYNRSQRSDKHRRPEYSIGRLAVRRRVKV